MGVLVVGRRGRDVCIGSNHRTVQTLLLGIPPIRQAVRMLRRSDISPAVLSVRPLIAGLLLLTIWAPAGLRAAVAAHEVPTSVRVQAFVKPEGNTLRVLTRVPLAAMRDMNLPLTGPGFIVLGEESSHIREAAEIWLAGYMRVFEDGRPLENERVTAARISIPSDPSFIDYRSALAHTLGPGLPPATQLMWDQAMLDVLIEYPISSDRSTFSIEPFLAHLGLTTTTTLRFLPIDGAERVFQYVGDPGLVRLDPRWHQAALSFVKLGFLHILEGIDHLLFLLCLVIPFRRLRPLVVVVTSFTIAHSITLIAAAFGMAPRALWFPPLIETLIALSIVYMAIENIIGANIRRRWMVAFGFGLVHGFGFSFLLAESLQFAGRHLVTSLLAFNIGVEIGQIAVLLVAIPALSLLFSRVVKERIGTIILSALVAHTAWHWMLDRGSTLRAYQFQWPVLDTAFLASAMRWGSLLLLVVGVAWFLYEVFPSIVQRDSSGQPGDSTGLNRSTEPSASTDSSHPARHPRADGDPPSVEPTPVSGFPPSRG